MYTDLIDLSGQTMGTRYAARFLPHKATNSEALHAALQDAVTRIDQQMSPWIEDSVLNQINAAGVGEWVPLPLETQHVIQKAIEVEAASNGAFSPTIAPIVQHYGFSAPLKGTGPVPEPGPSLARAVETADGALRNKEPVQLDLCGIAKGYGVDVMADTMLEFGITDFLVSIDGELRCLGQPDPDTPWQVAIEAPVPHIRRTACVLPCADLSIATSGGYRNFERSGAEAAVTHTIDPRTGTPLDRVCRSVVVAHRLCCDADAWATALMVMDWAEAEATIQDHDLNVLFLEQRDGNTLLQPYGRFA